MSAASHRPSSAATGGSTSAAPRRQASAASRRAFDERVERALGDPALQQVLAAGQDYVQALSAAARAAPDWPLALDEVARVRAATLAHLDRYVEEFAGNVEKVGGHVFFAADAAEARRHVVGLAEERGVRLVVKSKSMVTEEIGLNPALEAAGVEVVETDLGEFIVQLAGERPFHILKPAIHLPLDRIRALFSKAAGRDVGGDAHAMTRYARDTLREKFFAADMGISGANFGVAATGSVVLVTNEGNGRMVTTLPRTHVVVMGVERLVPTFPDLEAILKVLPRAGVGLRATTYVTALTGPRRAGEADGPEELHVVIVDNGRSRMLGSQVRAGAVVHPLRRLPRRVPGLSQDRRSRLRRRLHGAHRRRVQPAARRPRLPRRAARSPAACAAPAPRSARRAYRWPSSSASCAKTRWSRASWRRRGAPALPASPPSPAGRACGARSRPSPCRCCGS